jgi:hypothetical protein
VLTYSMTEFVSCAKKTHPPLGVDSFHSGEKIFEGLDQLTRQEHTLSGSSPGNGCSSRITTTLTRRDLSERLEAISQVVASDEQTSDMHKGPVDFDTPVPADNYSPVVAQPGEGSFNFPSLPVATKNSAVLCFRSLPILPMGGNQLNAASFEPKPEGVAVVSFIRNHPIRPASARSAYSNRLEGLRRELDLLRSGRVKGHSQRNTLAVCHHHKLCSLVLFGLSDTGAPFLAAEKLPSRKHSPQRMRPRSSSSPRKALQIFSQMPCSSQSFRRLQQVLGLGYRSGRSIHRAPVRRIQRIPSSTSRFFRQGRPRLFIVGSRGSILSHTFPTSTILGS